MRGVWFFSFVLLCLSFAFADVLPVVRVGLTAPNLVCDGCVNLTDLEDIDLRAGPGQNLNLSDNLVEVLSGSLTINSQSGVVVFPGIVYAVTRVSSNEFNSTGSNNLVLDAGSGVVVLGAGTNTLSNTDSAALDIDPSGSNSVTFHGGSYSLSSAGALSVGTITASTLDTGQGANELFDMDQNVLTTSNVVFAQINVDNLMLNGNTVSSSSGDLTLDSASGVVVLGAGDDLQLDDTNLYRNAADQLKTDDSFIVGGDLYVSKVVREGTGDITIEPSVGYNVTVSSGRGLKILGGDLFFEDVVLSVNSGTLTVEGLLSVASDLTVGNGYPSGLTLESDGDLYVGGDIYQSSGQVFSSDATRYTGSFEIADTLKVGVGAAGTDTDYLEVSIDGYLSDADDPVTVADSLLVSGSVLNVTNVGSGQGVNVSGGGISSLYSRNSIISAGDFYIAESSGNNYVRFDSSGNLVEFQRSISSTIALTVSSAGALTLQSASGSNIVLDALGAGIVSTNNNDLNAGSGTITAATLTDGSLSISSGNLQSVGSVFSDAGITAWLSLSGCGTGATVTSVAANGAITCSSISITESQVSDADWWDEDSDIAADEISESKINFATTCGSGYHLFVNGNDLACEADDDDPEAGDVGWTDLTDDGTFANGLLCTYDSANSRINCNSADATDDSVSSSELDNICTTNDRVLRRVSGSWACFDDSVYYDDTTVDGCIDCLDTTEIDDVYVLNSGDTMTGDLTIDKAIATIYLGSGGDSGPHGIVFDDSEGTSVELQLDYRTTPNQLVVEHVNSGDDIFYIDSDDDSAGFMGNLSVEDNLTVLGSVKVTKLGISSSITATEALGGSLELFSVYTYKVSAVDFSGSVGQPSSVSDTCIPTDIPLDMQRCSVSWGSVNHVSSYRLWRRKDSGNWYYRSVSSTSYSDISDAGWTDYGSTTLPSDNNAYGYFFGTTNSFMNLDNLVVDILYVDGAVDVDGSSNSGAFNVDGTDGSVQVCDGSCTPTSGYDAAGDLYVEDDLSVGGNSRFNRVDFYSTSIYLEALATICETDIHYDSSTRQMGACPSSKRFKENIVLFEDDFYKVLDLEPVEFSFIGQDKRNIGYIAESVDELGLEMLVSYDEQGPYSVKYDYIAVYLLEIIKDQQARLDDLEERVKLLESKTG